MLTFQYSRLYCTFIEAPGAGGIRFQLPKRKNFGNVENSMENPLRGPPNKFAPAGPPPPPAPSNNMEPPPRNESMDLDDKDKPQASNKDKEDRSGVFLICIVVLFLCLKRNDHIV